jgi:hypothetical protein
MFVVELRAFCQAFGISVKIVAMNLCRWMFTPSAAAYSLIRIRNLTLAQKTACGTFVSSAGNPIKGDVKSKFFSLPSWEKWMLSLQPAPLQPAPIFLLEEGFWF